MKPIVVSAQGLVHPVDLKEKRFRAPVRKMIAGLLISSTPIREQTRRLAAAVVRDARADGLAAIELVAVLKGAVVFASALAQEIYNAGGPPVHFNFIKAASYGNQTVHQGEVKIEGQIPYVRGKHVIIVEDIVDTGLTLSRLKAYLLQERKAATVRICALLNKPDRRLPELRDSLKIEYLGFTIPDLFVAGFGLDCAEQLRHLPFVVKVNEPYFRQHP